MGIIDLSMTIDNDCLTCGTPWHQKVRIERLGDLDSVGRNTSRIVLGSHSATHMDAPIHFLRDGNGIDKVDLNTCVGPVTCVDFRGIKENEIVALEDVKNLRITQRMLFVFGWCNYWKTEKYYECFPFFSIEAVEYLVRSGMRLMALDTPSPDDGGNIMSFNDSPNHKYLLKSNVVIVEYLYNTCSIDFGKNYEIIALPLKILDADGSPSRVVLRDLD